MSNTDTLFNGWALKEIKDKTAHGSDQRKRERDQRFLRYQHELLNLLEKHVPGSITGKPKLSITDEVIDLIQKWIEEPTRDARVKRRLRAFLRKGLSKGKSQLAWQLNLPASETTYHDEANPISPVSFRKLSMLQRQLNQFDKCLIPTDLDQKHRCAFYYGQLIYSAALFGGLTDPAAWLQLPFAKKKILYWQDHVWIDLFTDDYPNYTQARRGVRRWFMDPVSLILLNQLPPLPHHLKDRPTLRRWLNRSLSSYLNLLEHNTTNTHFFKTKKAWTANQWLDLVNLRLHLILPIYLARYCKGQLISSAWPERTWLRILNQQHFKGNHKPTELNSVPIQKADLNKNPPIKLTSSEKERAKLFSQIKAALYKKQGQVEPTFSEIQQRLKLLLENLQQHSPLLYCLTLWIKQRLKRKEIRRSSAYQQLTSIGRDLLSNFDEKELHNLSAEDFQQSYEVILENTPSASTRKDKATLLQRFHHFISSYLGVAPLNFKMADEGFFATPDANLIHETEYQIIFQLLLENSHLNPESHAQLIALILGYRCGLRISEVRNLKLEDLHYPWVQKKLAKEERPEKLSTCAATLLIRNNAFNKLKSQSSRRQLPLNLLLNNQERYELLSYHQLQVIKTDRKIKNAFLFSMHDQNNVPMDFSLVQQNLQYLMRQLTGDNQLRYHHLRHSFASAYLQITQSTTKAIPINKHLDAIQDKTETRKHLHQLSAYLGHTSPEVSLQHYVHNLDDILKDKLWPYSFDHRKTGHGALKNFLSRHDVASCVATLLNTSNNNLGTQIHTHKTLMGWLSKKLDLQEASTANEWLDYQHVDLHISQPDIARSLIDLNFDEWCAYLTAWHKGDEISQISQVFYLNENKTAVQASLFMGYFKEKKKTPADNMMNQRRLMHNGFPVRPPRTKAEQNIARICFEKSLRLLSSSKHGFMAQTGLDYIYSNYRHWNRSITLRYNSRDSSKLESFEKLLERVLPNTVSISKTRKPLTHRSYLTGEMQLHTPSKQAQYGPIFGLLLAYAVGRLRRMEGVI